MSTTAATVLLVDDDPDFLHLLERFFSTNGFACLTAANGPDALRALNLGDLPALIITDHDMPEMTGLEMVDKINAEHPAPPPIIIVTGGGASEIRVNAEARGAQAVFQKPVSLKTLLALAHTLINTA